MIYLEKKAIKGYVTTLCGNTGDKFSIEIRWAYGDYYRRNDYL